MTTTIEGFNGFNGFGADDLVMFQEGGKVMSGGYRVNSLLMKGGKSPITSYFKGGSLERRNDSDSDKEEDLNDIADSREDNKNKDPFNNLAVPAGILLIVQQPSQSEYEKKSYANNKSQNCDMLSDDIYDKLFEYASFKGTNKQKNKGTNKKITRNNKKGDKSTNELPKKQTKRNKTKI
jgi:hypothetical protein